ncbi:retention module-containing protein, partial [Achromobacter xylosoxidans]
MANSSPAVVNEITGRAWIRNSDGSLTELHQGSKVPAGSDIVTASGATVALQVENGMPIVIGEGRAVAVTEDMAGPLADPTEAAVAAPKGTDSDRLLAALQAGQDPFDVLDPTAATLTGGSGDDGGGSFVRLARILETTSPLDLAYPNPGRGADTIDRASSGAGGDGGAAGDNNNAPLAINDVARTDEKSAVRGNLLINDSDPDGDPLSLVSINGRPMTPNGVAVTGSNGGTFIVQPDGSYVFVPGTSFQHLPEGQTTTTTISYVVTDPSGATSTATVEVTVVGVNDPAQITAAKPGDDAGTVKEDEVSTANGKLNVVDADDGQSFFVAVADRAGVHGTFSIDANGNWVYNLNQADPRVQALAVGEKLTETFTVTTADGTTGTVTITINGTNDAPTISGEAAGDVKEDGAQEVSGQLAKQDVDTSDTHTWSVNDGGKGQYGTLTVDQNGKWTYVLDNSSDKVQALAEGQKVTDTITVTVDDGHGGKATQVITVTVTGTNDAPTISGTTVGEIREDDTSDTVSGQLTQHDVDTNDTHTWTVNDGGKGQYGSFTVDGSGKWTYTLDNGSDKVQALKEGETVTDTITVTVDDGHGGKATETITVTITGTNDTAVITPSKPGDDAGNVEEDGNLVTGGKLDVTDKDAGEATFNPQTDAKGDHGKFSIDANGNWKYELDNDDPKVQALAVGEKLVETFTVTTADGTKSTITVTIDGTNDDPKLSGKTDGAVAEDGTTSATGKLDVTDVDTSDTHTWTVSNNGDGQYGKFTVDANGNWKYELDNTSDKVQALKDGQKVTDTITVTVDDGHGGTATKTITVDITGTNDAAVITPSKDGDDQGNVKEDGNLVTGGKLDVTDKDAGEATFNPQTDAKGDHGKFSIDANGNWKYELDNDDPKVQALAVGEKLVETFTVTTADGTKSTITVTIDGTNDDPKLSGKTDGAVAEDGTTSATGKLDVTDVDTSDTHTWTVSNNGDGQYGKFTVDANGNWKYELDNTSDKVQALKDGQKVTDTITVTVDDGHGGTATKTITVDITGTNDAAVITPSKDGDDQGNVKEDGNLVTGGKLDVTDKDAGEATFNPQTDAKGDHGKFSIDANGNWKYELDNDDPKVQALAVGEKLVETFTVTTADGTKSTITVTIDGTNDDPKLSGKTDGAVAEDGTTSATGKLDVTDVDTSDTHTWTVSNNGDGQYGKFTVDANGNWKYELDNTSDKVQALKDGQKVTDTITVTVDDGHGGTATKTITVDITGTNDAAVITPSKDGDDQGNVKEDGNLVTGGKLDVTDKDAGEATFNPQTDAKGEHGKFSIDANGNWKYELDNDDPKVQALAVGEKLVETFTVTTADGTKSTITVTIDGTNDDPKLSGKTDGAVAEDGTTSATGKLDVTDVDTSDTHTWTVSNNGDGQYGKFTVDANGNWKYELDNTSDKVQALKDGEKVTDTITVTVDDGHGGKATETITVTITGTNDTAVITPSKPGDDAGNVKEDGNLVTGGKLDVTDKDAGEATFNPQTDAKGDHGKFSIDANGNWKYELDNDDPKVQALAVGEKLVETFTVTTADGTKSTITVTIDGTNDDPKLSGKTDGAVAEDGATSATGKLDVTDVDTSDTHTWTVSNNGDGQYGKFTVDANGNWKYELDNTSDKVQALKDGEKVTDTITVTVDDGHGGTATKTITVDITGTNDAAVITPSKPGDDKGTVQEDTTLTANGKLDIVDKDAGEATFKPQTDFHGQYGTFSIDANGNWSFKLDNDAKAIQQLGAKESLTETFTVTSADGTTGQVVITINGTNDAPTITGAATGDVTEDGAKAVSGQLTQHDVDVNDKHTWSLDNDGKGQYGSFTLDQNGKWTYTLDNDSAKVQALAEGQKATETITVTVDDGNGGKATQVITVTVTGTNDAPTITGTATGQIQEGSNQDVSGQLTKHDVDTNDTHTWSLNNDGKGQYGSFTLDQNGKWTYKLDNANPDVKALKDGEHLTDTITVTVDDGHGGKATQVITITVDGTSDGAVITPSKPGDDKGTVQEDTTLTASGKLDVVDPDAGEAVFRPQTDFQGQYGKFSIDANGNWSFKLDNDAKAIQQLGAKDHLTETFTVVTADGTTGQVTITINGTNDAPTISGVATGAVKEDAADTTVSGQLAKQDVDATDKHTWSVNNEGKGQYGTFTVDQNGKWTYVLDNDSAKVQALTEGQKVTDTITVTVDDGNGGTATQVITVDITGTNDAAVITPSKPGDDKGTVQEDTTLTANGKLDIVDKDAGQASFKPQTDFQGQYGKFSIDANGNWSFKLDNDAKAIQ